MNEREQLTIEIARCDHGIAIIGLGGELDLNTIPTAEDRLLEELRANDGVVVDLTRLEFIDSSGIGMLIKIHREAEGDRRLHAVISPGTQVERVFSLAGIGKALPLHTNRDDAIAAAAPDG